MGTEDLDSLRLEVGLMAHPGWQLRRARIMARLEQEGRGLMLGTIADDKERERAIGRCQVLKDLLDMDDTLQEAWKQFQEETREEKEEGGDLGVFYEAAQ